jgi:ribosome biogenesis protein ENP2
MLSDDWTKSLHLQRDRSLQLHTQGGLHHTIRLPIYGRALGYHSPSADALVACTGKEVFRFNLEEGRYMTPLNVAQWTGAEDVEGVNCLDVNPRHGLWSFGLDGGGTVEFWDPRSRSALTRLTLPAKSLLPMQDYDVDALFGRTQKLSVSSLKSHPTDGLSIAVGTSTGHTLLYDLRSPTPFAVKDQGYGEPVRVVDWLRGGGTQEDSGRVVSADSKVIKVWDKNSPDDNHLSLHPPNQLTDLHAVPDTGLLMVACDASPLSMFYVPEFGPAPGWASHVDSTTEKNADEIGAGKGAYTDYKFVDRAELETIGLSYLIGTPTLKPYMHGYFLSLKLYQAARHTANPQSYAEHREKAINAKLEAKAASRIRARRDAPKVNKALAEKMAREAELEEAKNARKRARRAAEGEDGEDEEEAGKPAAKDLLADPRFADMFTNPDFEIDQGSQTFARLNPATARDASGGRYRTAVESEDEESDHPSSGIEDDESEDEPSDEEMSVDEPSADEDEPSEEGEGSESGDGEEEEDSEAEVQAAQAAASGKPSRAFPLASGARPSLVVGGQAARPQTFGQRLAASKPKTVEEKPDGVLAMKRSADGGMEMSFIPKAGGKKDDSDDEYGGGTFRRRSKVEKFGAGLEKGAEEEENMEQGRKTRRHPGRSASKNTFRRR